MATVREIRASDETSIEIDRRMGWSMGYASRIEGVDVGGHGEPVRWPGVRL